MYLTITRHAFLKIFITFNAIYQKNKLSTPFNSLVPSVLNIYSTFDQNFNFNLRFDPDKISYERRVYESEDEKSLP